LNESNFKIWNSNVENSEDLQRQLELNIEHIKPDSSIEDILYEVLLKDGLPLTTKIEKKQLVGKDVYAIENGTMLICLDKQITPQLIDAMATANPSRVICLDAGFRGNDQLKVNAVQTFKTLAEQQEREIVFRTV
jgi:adenine-specific DNA-methyltransferase